MLAKLLCLTAPYGRGSGASNQKAPTRAARAASGSSLKPNK